MGARQRAHQHLLELLWHATVVHHEERGDEFFAGRDMLALPGFEDSGPRQLVLRLAAALADGQAGTRPLSDVLADVALDVAQTLHREICKPDPNDSGPGLAFACSKDARVAHDVLVSVGARFLHVEFSDGVTDTCERSLLQRGLTDHELAGSLEATLCDGIRPLWDRREPPRLSEHCKIFQMNTAISKVTTEFEELRQLGLQARKRLSTPKLHFDVTSDFARPESRYTKLVDGGAVRSAILHAAGMAVVTRYGRFGTAMSWTRAEDLLMPVLVLNHASELDRVARYPGELAFRTTMTYDAMDDAIDRIAEFLSQNEERLERRQRMLLDYASRDISAIQRRLNEADVATFDNSVLPWELVRFHTDSPVHWFQAAPEHRNEILLRLGLATTGTSPQSGTAPSGPVQSSRISLEDYDLSMGTLLRHAELEGLSWSRLDRLREVFRAEQVEALPVSGRPGPYSVHDWRSLDKRTPDDLP